MQVEFDPTYSARKIEYKNCIECGLKYRHTGIFYPQPKKYRHVEMKDYCLCDNCYCKEMFKDLSER